MSTSQLSRRSLVTSAAALPALAIPAVAVANPDVHDMAAMVRRAEEIVDLLGGRVIRAGWHDNFDKDRAAQFLQDVRAYDYEAEDVDHEQKINAWARDHGVSHDWLFAGDPRNMICTLAGHSPRAAVISANEPDPIFAAIKQAKKAAAVEEAAYRARDAVHRAFQDRYGCVHPSGMPKEMAEMFEKDGHRNPYWALHTHKQITALKSHPELGQHVPLFHRLLNVQTDDYEENVAPVYEAADSENSKLCDAIRGVFATTPTTLAGMRAKIDFVMSTQHATELLVNDRPFCFLRVL
jgi:hypothetical protein